MEEGRTAAQALLFFGIVEPVGAGHFPMCDTGRRRSPQKAPALAANAVVGAAPCLY